MKRNPNNKIKTNILLFALCTVFLLSPVSSNLKTQKAEALIDLGGFGGLQLVKDIPNSIINSLMAASTAALEMKELFTDGLAFDIAQKALKQMLGNIISTVNTGGQNASGEKDGSPQFVTNLGEHMAEVSDKKAAEVLYGSALNSVCAPFQDDVRQMLKEHYIEGTRGGIDVQVSCSLNEVSAKIEAFQSGNFSEGGGYKALFKMALDPNNVKLGAYLSGTVALNDAIEQKKIEENTILGWGNGFESQKTCTTVDTPAGPKQTCNIHSPGAVIKDTYTKALGTGIDSLLNADEMNEVIGGLFANLADQAISGVNGMLGLSDNVFGSNGAMNYLDSVLEEHNNKPPITQNNGNLILRTLEIETQVALSEGAIARAVSDITQCQPDVEPLLPQSFKDILAEYNRRLIESTQVVMQLQAMEAEYSAENTSSERISDLLQKRQRMISDGDIKGSAVLSENQSILATLEDAIEKFKDDINYVEIDCDVP